MPRIAALSLLALALLGPAPDAMAADTIRAGTPAANNFTFLPLRIGVDRGAFAREGLDVEPTDFGGGAKLQQAMVAGAVDIAVTAGTDFAFVAKGAPERGVAAMGNHPPLGLVVPYDSPAKTGADIKGKRIGVTTVGSLTEWLARRYSMQQGWGPDGLVIAAIGSDLQNQVALMSTGQVDGLVAPVGLGLQLELQKRGRLLFSSFDIGAEFLAEAIFASKPLIASNPGAVRHFLKAWFDNMDWMRAHKTETVEMARHYTGYTPEVEAEEYDLVMPRFSSDGKFNADALKQLAQSFLDMKVFDTAPDLTPLYTEAYLPKK
jgi:ABC-type nitrate/sulfonate/bicarbonate transport system substrate-binding protein